MKDSVASTIGEGDAPDSYYLLRQRTSGTFWNGKDWAGTLASAKHYTDMDAALACARRMAQALVDLCVRFPRTNCDLIIPLGTHT